MTSESESVHARRVCSLTAPRRRQERTRALRRDFEYEYEYDFWKCAGAGSVIPAWKCWSPGLIPWRPELRWRRGSIYFHVRKPGIISMKFCWIALFCCLFFVISVDADTGTFRLESPEWHDGGTVPTRNLFNGSGCNGSNISPGFHWSGAPKGTRSFAMTIYDPDAPAPGGWWHWVVFNIPSAVSNLPAGAGDKGSSRLPPGSSQCNNDYGESGYGGPCPPPGTTHRYVVKIYALGVEKIHGGAETNPGRVARLIQEDSIGSAQLTVSFGR